MCSICCHLEDGSWRSASILLPVATLALCHTLSTHSPLLEVQLRTLFIKPGIVHSSSLFLVQKLPHVLLARPAPHQCVMGNPQNGTQVPLRGVKYSGQCQLGCRRYLIAERLGCLLDDPDQAGERILGRLRDLASVYLCRWLL
jgi:hypothetical protein